MECGASWVLVNASPDLRQQLLGAGLSPASGTRASPINELVLTDAELDHVAGLLLLREATGLRVHGTEPVLSALAGPLALRRTLEAYTGVEWVPVPPDQPVTACHGQLEIDVIPLGHKGSQELNPWLTRLSDRTPITLRSRPMPSISSSTTSPGDSCRPRSIPQQPPGVPDP